MVEFVILAVSVSAFLLSAFIHQRAHNAIDPYLPPHFVGRQKYWAHYYNVFDLRIPRSIQRNEVHAAVLSCIAFGGFSCFGVAEWESSNPHNKAGYLIVILFFLISLQRAFSASQKYRRNLLRDSAGSSAGG